MRCSRHSIARGDRWGARDRGNGFPCLETLRDLLLFLWQ
jgi:hypothetical protein